MRRLLFSCHRQGLYQTIRAQQGQGGVPVCLESSKTSCFFNLLYLGHVGTVA